MTRTIQLELADEAATQRLGEDIAAILATGDAIGLAGDLGMGKTTLARATIRALAGDPELEVPSPTFTLVQPYAARVPVQHFDLYRLGAPDEIEELGFFEAIGAGAVIVEWPEIAAGALPDDMVKIALSEAGSGRLATVSGPNGFIERLERSLAIRAFLGRTSRGEARRTFLVGDASARAYETIDLPGQEQIVLMNAPRRPDGPPIRDNKPYSQIAHLAESVTPFVAIAKVLREKGFAAPVIHGADLDKGLLLVEYLGAEGVLDASGAPIAERYIAAAELLAAMHGHKWPARIDVADGVVHHIPPYDHGALAIEVDLLTDWYFAHATGRRPTKDEHDEFHAAWRETFDRLDQLESGLVLRDFHSPNLIWRGERTGHDRIGLIDFQDALIGPSAYDVASLGMDARVTVAPGLERAVIDAYCTAREAQGGFDRAGFDLAYAIMAAQRNSKILGIFVRLNERDGKPSYLRHLPRMRDYVTRSLAHPSLERLRSVYVKLGII